MSAPTTAASPPLPLRHCYWVVPGLLLAGEHPGGSTRDKTKERLKKLLAAGIECFVDLTKPTELLRYDTHLPFYVEYTRKPITDHGLPGSREQMVEILEHVSNAMRAGRPVYVHCRAGIGRTGTVIGCLLVERGLAGDAALDALNRLWQQSRRSKSWAFIPETEAQSNYVREWQPGVTGAGFELSSLASAVAGVGPMIAGGGLANPDSARADGRGLAAAADGRRGALKVADVQTRAANQATGAGQARAAIRNLAAGKGPNGSKKSGAGYAAGAGLSAAAAQARAAVERGDVPRADAVRSSARTEPKHAEPTREESMRGEPTRTEPDRAKPTRAESARAEQPARGEPALGESMRAEPTGTEPGRAKPTRAESMRAEPARGEPVGAEPMRAEPLRGDALRVETVSIGASQVESLLAEPMSAGSLPFASAAAETVPAGSAPAKSAAAGASAGGAAAAGSVAVQPAAESEPLVDADPLLDPETLAVARQLRERFVGALFGLAVGDAVAAPTQFRRPGTFTPVGDMIGGGPFDLPRGAWTDDTAMALCLAESLLERDGFDPRDQVQRYGRWQEEGYLSSTGQCIGITASTARSLAMAQWRRVVFPGSHDPEQLDPEPLSRVVSIALFYFASLETTLQQAADSSRTTCQAPAVVDACRRLGRALNAALSGQPKDRILAEAAPTTAAAAQTNNTAATALAAACWAFSSTDNFRDAVLRAANVGGNSDVVASVCGALAGAHYGVSAIPPSWRNGLIHKDLIETYADRMLAHGLVSLSA